MSPSRRAGFSLLEMLIVMGILAALAGFLLPAVRNARRMAMQVRCASRLGSIGHAFILYASDNDGQMVTTSALGTSSFNWVFWQADRDINQSALAPYLGLRDDQLRSAFRCPAQPPEDQVGYGGGRYTLTFSMNAFLSVYPGMTYSRVRDPSRKFLVYDENQRSDDDIFWYQTNRDTLAGRHGSNSTQGVTYIEGDHATTVIRGMGNVLLFDGHVELRDNAACHDPALNDPTLP